MSDSPKTADLAALEALSAAIREAPRQSQSVRPVPRTDADAQADYWWHVMACTDLSEALELRQARIRRWQAAQKLRTAELAKLAHLS